MSDNQPSQDLPDQPAWDRNAARARYRRLMRSKPMIALYTILILVMLFSYAWAGAAVVAADVEALPGHDITVGTERCLACHGTETAATAANAPRMNHPAAPTCGFCHRQGLPEAVSQSGWARPVEP